MMERPLRNATLLRMGLRASLLQATWNYERQQGLGWAFALAPAIERLYADPAERRDRLAEHTAYFNTQPTLASLALGAVAGLEERRAAGGGVDHEAVARVKVILGSSLAAIGDRLFWFTLRPFSACLGVLVALGGSWLGAPLMWVCYNLFHIGLRLFGVGWGFRAGPTVLNPQVRGRFNRLVGSLAVAGAALVGVVVAVLLVPGGQPATLVFQALLAAGLSLGLIAAQRARPSPTEWALGTGLLCVIATWFR